MDEGRYASISEMAAAERIERGYLGKVLQMTLLPPAVVEAILEGRQGREVGLPVLLAETPTNWRDLARSRQHTD